MENQYEDQGFCLNILFIQYLLLPSADALGRQTSNPLLIFSYLTLHWLFRGIWNLLQLLPAQLWVKISLLLFFGGGRTSQAILRGPSGTGQMLYDWPKDVRWGLAEEEPSELYPAMLRIELGLWCMLIHMFYLSSLFFFLASLCSFWKISSDSQKYWEKHKDKNISKVIRGIRNM